MVNNESAMIFSAPGRTEICGNHTDHQHGKVLAAAINLDTRAVVRPNADNVIRINSEGFTFTIILDGNTNIAVAVKPIPIFSKIHHFTDRKTGTWST